MNENLLARIDNKRDSLSKGQCAIAKYIEEHYDKAAFMTAHRLGEIVGVSESTVVRFAIELGYEGYPKLQKAMQEMIKDKLTSLQRIDVTVSRINEKGDVLEAVLSQDIEKIRRTIEETSRVDFQRAVESIVGAQTIYIFAVRSTTALSSFLGYYLELILGNVRIINTTSRSEMYEQLFRISDKDVFIGISFPRYSQAAARAMKFAHERRAATVALTDSMISPIVAYADSVLLARSDIVSVVDSLVAPLSMINAIIAATVMMKKESVKDTFSQLEDVWKKQGVYTGASDSSDDGGDDI